MAGIPACDNCRSASSRFGGVEVSYAVWFIAFLPCALLTIFTAWRFAIWAYPPEIESVGTNMEELKAKLRGNLSWTPMAKKATVLSLLAIALWMTDFIHHIQPSVIALAVALAAFLPFVNILDVEDMQRTNLMPVFFVAAALCMSNVAQATGALKLLTKAQNATPADPRPSLRILRVLEARKQWPEAIGFARALTAKFKNDSSVADALAQVDFA